MHAAYPATPAAYPATPAAYPATPAAYPATPAAYPATTAAYPVTPAEGCVGGEIMMRVWFSYWTTTPSKTLANTFSALSLLGSIQFSKELIHPIVKMRIFSFYLFSCICLSGVTHISGADVYNWLLDLFVKCKYNFTSSLTGPVERRFDLDVSQNEVHFYDIHMKGYKSFHIEKAAKEILSIEKLDKNQKFYVFVGGYKMHIDTPTADLVRETFKTVPGYLIIIDHSAYTNNFDGDLTAYKRSVKYVYSIGVQLAKMLDKLNKGGISAKHIHAIGHGLGSQILGHVGQNFTKMTGKKIARITALDPAGPCFSNSPKEEQIRAGIAEYVEVYHCDDGFFGTTKKLGDVDFFMNEGKTQPQCKLGFWKSLIATNVIKSKTCSHKICVSAWMSTIAHRDRFPAKQCDSYPAFKKGKCSGNNSTIAGFANPGNAKGIYYFSTEKYDKF
ncbi:hypothetical protein HF086_003373 [Spodoptera exigua]|uniref:Lipase domain-containing protein n=1 Tax=Spodoptera exigua TaxID=7107 RepID=A0A922MYU4_SPOEX|nr:hypothetical protein HF086_003373 [Spodoptera exigua]